MLHVNVACKLGWWLHAYCLSMMLPPEPICLNESTWPTGADTSGQVDLAARADMSGRTWLP